MLPLLLLAFILLPAVELVLLIQVGLRIGWWTTAGIILATGLLGAYLAKHQGLRAWREIRATTVAGRVPSVELVAGALFVLGAGFLLTPGFITDTLGFLLMVPGIRRATAKGVINRFRGRVKVVHRGPKSRPDVVDVEYRKEE